MNEPPILDDALRQAVSQAAQESGRTESEQVAHWLRIGRAIEKMERFDYSRVEAAISHQLRPDELGELEYQIWLETFIEDLKTPTPDEEAFFAERRAKGLGVGLDEQGDIVGAHEISKKEAGRRLERFRKSGTDWAGACAGAVEVAECLRKSRSTIDQWRTTGTAIAWKDGRRNYIFPLGQFGKTAPLNGIAEVMALASTPKRAWIWLKSGHAAFDGKAPVDLLREDRVEEVVAAAKRDLVF